MLFGSDHCPDITGYTHYIEFELGGGDRVKFFGYNFITDKYQKFLYSWGSNIPSTYITEMILKMAQWIRWHLCFRDTNHLKFFPMDRLLHWKNNLQISKHFWSLESPCPQISSTNFLVDMLRNYCWKSPVLNQSMERYLQFVKCIIFNTWIL